MEGCWRLAWVLLLLMMLHSTAAMYCGDSNCYELLGAERTATEQNIKKLYRRLSLQYHPDKNPDPEAKLKFQQLARANEILTNDRLRRAYDYYLDHPEDHRTNQWRYYEAQFTSRMAQSDVRVVVVGAIAIATLIQYLSRRALYLQAMENVRKTPRYKNLLKRLQAEAEGAAAGSRAAGPRSRKSSKKEAGKLSAEELKELELRADAEVVMHGGYGKPVWHELIAVQIFVFPYTLVKFVAWQIRWLLNYTIRGLPYSREDQAYLTRGALSVGTGYWNNLPASSQDEMLALRLWQKGAMEDERLLRRLNEITRKATYLADLGKG